MYHFVVRACSTVRQATGPRAQHFGCVLLLFFSLVTFLSGTASAAAPASVKKPTNLTATSSSPSEVNLSWRDNSNNESGFKVERKVGASGTYSHIATVPANTTTYRDTGLSASTTYIYRVSAYITGGSNSYSNEASVKTSSPTPTPTPSPLPTPSLSPTPIAEAPPIPELDLWVAHMRQGGAAFCNEAEINSMIGGRGVYDDPATPHSDGEQNIWYYDGTKVYMQMARYLDEPDWYRCAGYVKNAYRNWVIGMSDGATGPVGPLGGWRVFPQGLARDYLRTGDPLSKEAVARLIRYSAFAGSAGAATCAYSRETAYLINAYLAAEEMGEPRDPRLATSVNYALGHINQWFVQKVSCGGNEAAFMVGLTVDALIAYYEKTGDPRVPDAVRMAADGLWSTSWSATDEGFSLNIYSNQTGHPDLNLLVAPMYAWLWQMTGEAIYLERGDTAFSAGVRKAYLGAGKHFSQNYRWSFSYVKWRSSPPGRNVPLVGFEY